MSGAGPFAGRVRALRNEMQREGVKAYLVPMTDPHGTEYPPPCWRRLHYLTGFTGSAGEAVITEKYAGLWTDGRYHLQAASELDPGVFTLFKKGHAQTPSKEAWLLETLPPQCRVGVDPRLLSLREYERLKAHLGKKGIKVLSIEENLVDRVWPDRPTLRFTAIRSHALSHSGESASSKLSRIRALLAAEGADGLVVTRLDDLAWLFNIRAEDGIFTPLVLGFALVTLDRAELFLDENSLTPGTREALEADAAIRPYGAFAPRLEATEGKRIWIDPGKSSQWVGEHLRSGGADLLSRPCPLDRLRTVKNKVEIDGMFRAHQRDGLAWVRFLMWLDGALSGRPITEYDVAEKLETFRKTADLYRGPSFETIAAFQDNGAVVHYTPGPGRAKDIDGDGILLIDAGSQYPDGTTDVTRCIAVGRPDPDQRDCFTRVLKGHIALAFQVFPLGTRGAQLDALARCALWDRGLDFSHGVGHGVGVYLCVHEEPVTLSKARDRDLVLAAGMILTIEPGYYREGAFGVRFENVMLVREDAQKAGFLCFEALTRVPIDLRLVEESLLTEKEKAWINAYHEKVRASLLPLMTAEEASWLHRVTSVFCTDATPPRSSG